MLDSTNHRRGAFTGGLADRVGLFQQADSGTLLLDEAVPVGAASPVPADVRVEAATNVDLCEAVEQGRFRRDFLDRLEVLTLRLPPLRERVEDLPLLVEHLFEVANQEEGTEVRPPGRPDLAAMARTCGDLSIRVLKNAVRRRVVVKRRGRVRCEDLAEAGLLGVRGAVAREAATDAVCVRQEHFLAAIGAVRS